MTRGRTSVRSWIVAAALAAATVALIATLRDQRPQPPFVMFRTLAPAAAFGRVAIVPLEAPTAARYVAPLSCSRVSYAGGAGVCSVEEGRGRDVTHAVYLFNRAFARRHRIELSGIPVRMRVSPDGRFAGITVYGEEESPAGERLATESIIVDIATGRVLADLREFALDRGSFAQPSGPVDIAGVTFQSDGDAFYASFSAGADRYLVAGSVNRRTLTLLRPGIANEALSPDGRQLIAKTLTGPGLWQITVVDLETWTEIALNQGPRSVDDQVEWLDATHVVYHDVTERGTGLWKLSTDGRTGPQLLIPDAFSAAVQR